MNTLKALLITITLLLSTTTYAEFEVLEMHSPGDLGHDSYSIFLDNGEILEVDPSNVDLIETLNEAMLNNSKISINKISNNPNSPDLISSAQIVSAPEPQISHGNRKQMYTREGFEQMDFKTTDPLEKSYISILPSYNHAQKVMDYMNGNTHDDSQCYNRAHMWSYEALVKNRVNLGKLWIYFSRKYIREFRHKWWFHVTPYTLVGAAKDKYALDRGFTKIPYTIENWKNIFIKNKAQCAEVKSYSTYQESNGSGNEYCYFIYSSQYYWQPWQLKNLSTKSQQTWGYRSNQMRIAYRDALRGNWDRSIPAMPRTPVRSGTDIVVPSEPPRPAREVDSYQGYSRRTKVLYRNFRGKVEKVFSNGTAIVDLKRRGTVRVKIEELAKEVRYHQGFRKGEDVYTSNGRKAEIDHLFDNGMAIVDVRRQRHDIVVHIRTLRKR